MALPGTPANAEISAEIRQNHILFPNGGTQLDAAAVAQIDLLAKILQAPPLNSACLKLVGYSDASGGQSVNLAISKSRAEAVSAALSAEMGGGDRILETEGLGATDFLAELPATDRYQRRVAILARACE